jgi:glycolate oxidase FAD binding subunit
MCPAEIFRTPTFPDSEGVLKMLQPRDEKDLLDIVARATQPFAIQSLNTKVALGRPVEAQPLSLAKFSGVQIYEPSELILEAGAATSLDEIESMLSQSNQQLAFDPPDYAGVFGTSRGSIGSLLLCNLSGPRRLTAGAARDHILGVAGVSGFGEPFKGGGRVVKNVTGYDMPRLMAGSFGTLAILTTVTFKVLPKPETETTLIILCTDYVDAGAIMRAAMQAPCDVSCASYLPGTGVLLRLEGIAASVADRKQRLKSILEREATEISDRGSSNQWQVIRDLKWLRSRDRIVWKISLPPTDGPALANALSAQGAHVVLDWSGGLVWAEMENFINVRTLIKSGQAQIFCASEDLRVTEDVFHPQQRDLAALSRRVKQSLDPRGLLNPNRMYGAF